MAYHTNNTPPSPAATDVPTMKAIQHTSRAVKYILLNVYFCSAFLAVDSPSHLRRSLNRRVLGHPDSGIRGVTPSYRALLYTERAVFLMNFRSAIYSRFQRTARTLGLDQSQNCYNTVERGFTHHIVVFSQPFPGDRVLVELAQEDHPAVGRRQGFQVFRWNGGVAGFWATVFARW